MRRPETWVMVADASRARLYRVDFAERRLEVVHEDETLRTRAKAGDIVTDRQGSRQDSGGPGQRSGFEPETDPKRHEKARFAARAAAEIEAAANAHRFEQLVLVAAPQMLGDLRAELSGPVSSRITREIAKNLAPLGPRELEAQLGPELWG